MSFSSSWGMDGKAHCQMVLTSTPSWLQSMTNPGLILSALGTGNGVASKQKRPPTDSLAGVHGYCRLFDQKFIKATSHSQDQHKTIITAPSVLGEHYGFRI